MYSIKITNSIQNSITLIPDYFIDRHLAAASGEFVKVYLYIQRHLKDQAPLTVPNIADSLCMTEADVNRALNYWKTEGVLTFEEPASEPAVPLSRPAEAETCAALSVPSKQTLSPALVASRMEEQGLSHLAFITETYLGKPLTQTEISTLFYFYDQLHFPVELIEYLLEYCVSNNKKSMRYIETVAISWFEQGIDSVERAKEAMVIYNKNYYTIMKTFGISNRNPGAQEAAYIKKWLDEYHFDLTIVLEACNRTLSAISQPSFPYTDTILTRWHKAGVRTMADIRALDSQYHSKNKTSGRPQAEQKAPASSANRFHNFEQRDYDYQDLEQQFIRKVNGMNKPPQG